jgi:hypothetical protein
MSIAEPTAGAVRGDSMAQFALLVVVVIVGAGLTLDRRRKTAGG